MLFEHFQTEDMYGLAKYLAKIVIFKDKNIWITRVLQQGVSQVT